MLYSSKIQHIFQTVSLAEQDTLAATKCQKFDFYVKPCRYERRDTPRLSQVTVQTAVSPSGIMMEITFALQKEKSSKG
jgi:hypothetical protein